MKKLRERVGDALVSVKLRSNVRSVHALEQLAAGSLLEGVGFHGRALWMSFGEWALVVNVTPWTHVSVVPPPKRRAGLRVRLSSGPVWVSASHAVSARVMRPWQVRALVRSLGPSAIKFVSSMIIRERALWFSVPTTADALLDQRVVSGVGPRLASEALYAAGVDPTLPPSQGVNSRLARELAAAIVVALDSPDSARVPLVPRVPPVRSDARVYCRRRAACGRPTKTFSALKGVVHVVPERYGASRGSSPVDV